MYKNPNVDIGVEVRMSKSDEMKCVEIPVNMIGRGGCVVTVATQM